VQNPISRLKTTFNGNGVKFSHVESKSEKIEATLKNIFNVLESVKHEKGVKIDRNSTKNISGGFSAVLTKNTDKDVIMLNYTKEKGILRISGNIRRIRNGVNNKHPSTYTGANMDKLQLDIKRSVDWFKTKKQPW